MWATVRKAYLFVRVFLLLIWLPTMALGPNTRCYLAQSWRENETHSHISEVYLCKSECKEVTDFFCRPANCYSTLDNRRVIVWELILQIFAGEISSAHSKGSAIAVVWHTKHSKVILSFFLKTNFDWGRVRESVAESGNEKTEIKPQVSHLRLGAIQSNSGH